MRFLSIKYALFAAYMGGNRFLCISIKIRLFEPYYGSNLNNPVVNAVLQQLFAQFVLGNFV